MKFDWDLFHRVIGEFAGTVMLVFLGCLCCISGPVFPRDMADIGIGWGIAVLCPVHCFGFLSSCHINPAVSICAFVLGIMEVSMMLIYIIVQIIGSFVGFGLVYLVAPKQSSIIENVETVLETAQPKLCCCNPDPSLKLWQAVLIEYLMTSALLFCVCGLWDPRSGEHFDSPSIRLGLIVAGLVFVGGSYTGASLNIARTLPPHIIQNSFKHLWVYFVGQLMAAIITPLVWRFILTPWGERGSVTND